MSFARDLKDYVDVHTRIERFYEKYPEGSLQTQIVEDDGTRIVIKALAFRSPEDPRPGVGHAEEIRGQGMVNKTSALENGETSAWGRALAALGFEVKNGIASRQEVEIAQAKQKDGRTQPAKDRPASEKQVKFAQSLAGKLGIEVVGVESKSSREVSQLILQFQVKIAARDKGLTHGQVKTKLVELGVEDISDLDVALNSLSLDQATLLKDWLGVK